MRFTEGRSLHRHSHEIKRSCCGYLSMARLLSLIWSDVLAGPHILHFNLDCRQYVRVDIRLDESIIQLIVSIFSPYRWILVESAYVIFVRTMKKHDLPNRKQLYMHEALSDIIGIFHIYLYLQVWNILLLLERDTILNHIRRTLINTSEQLPSWAIMGDSGTTISTRWAPPTAPQALPLGKGNIYPLDEPHVSVTPHNIWMHSRRHQSSHAIRLLVFLCQPGIPWSGCLEKRNGW